jgi:hypothetical protein
MCNCPLCKLSNYLTRTSVGTARQGGLRVGSLYSISTTINNDDPAAVNNLNEFKNREIDENIKISKRIDELAKRIQILQNKIERIDLRFNLNVTKWHRLEHALKRSSDGDSTSE